MSPEQHKPSGEAPLVSVLVLNYNGRHFLDDCFQTVLAASYPNFEVIMIDNNSDDDSVAYTQQHYPEVEVFQNGVDAGFSLSYNNAFKIARGKYYVLLNNDVKVAEDWLEPLVEAAEEDETIGALQPKLVSMREPDMFEYAGASGGYLDVFGYPFTRGRVFHTLEPDEGQYNDVVRVFWTTGAAMFLRASVLEVTGGLDEEFVHHMEEIDLCYRINLTGYTLKAIPSSLVYHYGGGTIPYNSYNKLYWNHRNSLLMMMKNLGSQNVLRFFSARLLLDMATAGWALVRLQFKQLLALMHAHLWLLFHPGMIWRKRRDVQNRRKVSDKELIKLLYPKSIALQYFIKKRKTFKELKEAVKDKWQAALLS